MFRFVEKCSRVVTDRTSMNNTIEQKDAMKRKGASRFGRQTDGG